MSPPSDDMRNGSNEILLAIGDSRHIEELTLDVALVLFPATFASLLRNTLSLKKLTTGPRNFVDGADLGIVAAAMEGNKTLETMHFLPVSPATLSGTETLLKGLRSHPRLQELKLVLEDKGSLFSIATQILEFLKASTSLYHFHLEMKYCYVQFLDLLVEGLTAARTLNKLTLSARINPNACATFSSFMRSNVADVSIRELCINIPEDRDVEMDTMIASIFAEPPKHTIASSLLVLEVTRLKQAELFFSNLSASGSAIHLEVMRLDLVALAGYKQLCQCIPMLSRLRELQISWPLRCDPTSSYQNAKRMFVAAIRQNGSLKRICMRIGSQNWSLPSGQARQVKAYLKRNESIPTILSSVRQEVRSKKGKKILIPLIPTILRSGWHAKKTGASNALIGLLALQDSIGPSSIAGKRAGPTCPVGRRQSKTHVKDNILGV
jgi:hypothetical protein